MEKYGSSVFCKIKTPEPIVPKFVTVDYLIEATCHTKFGENPFAEVF